MESYPPLDERSARAIAILLYDEPLAAVTELKRVETGSYRLRFTDARDGREHVLLTTGDFIDWIDSVIAGRALQPAVAVCSACGKVHGDRNLAGELLAPHGDGWRELGLLRPHPVGRRRWAYGRESAVAKWRRMNATASRLVSSVPVANASENAAGSSAACTRASTSASP